MPYSSSLFTFIGEQLRQPNWWAAIASVGIHGILGASTPVISAFYPPPKPPGKVEVLQLTAAEMSRLPQTLPAQISPPKFSISPIPAPPNVIPPLPPEPSDLQFPALPPGMSSFLPPRSSLPPLNSPLPSNDVPSSPPPNRPLPSNPPPQPPQPTPSTPPPLQGEPLQSPPPVRNDLQTESDLDKYRNADSRRPPFEPTKIYTPEDFPQGGTTPNPNKTALNPDPRQVSPTGGSPEGNPGNVAPTPSVEDPTKKNRLAESPLVTAMRQKMEAERQARQTPNAGAQGGSTSASNEQDIAFANTYSSLLSRFQQAYPNLEPMRYVSLPVAYPKEACSQKLEDKVIYGVVVKPSGAIATAELLATKGYSILDLAAKNAIRTYKFPATSAPKLYPLVFEFKYDQKICSSQPVVPSPSPKPSPTPQPPKSSPTPQPPKPSPTPQPPSPTPTPVPQQSAPPSPTPTPIPQQSAPSSPKPTPETSPIPTPETSPIPTPETSPTPTPETSPTPTPETSPIPTPETSPTPTPETSPTPTPETTVN